jgi:ADP-ribose pyrophosphatase
MSRKWEVLGHVVLYKRFFRLDEYRVRYDKFEGGSNEVVREVFERGDAVAVLPYDPQRDEIVLVEQFRAGAVKASLEKSVDSPWLVELIAGMIDKGETAEDVVRREAMEEAGCELQELIRIYHYLVSPGGTTEQVTLYAARADTTTLDGAIHGLDHEHEDIKVHVIKREDALEMLNRGRISNAVTLIGLQWLALNYRDLQARWL